MMRRILTASLRFRFIVVAASVAMLVVGGLQLRDTPVDVFPEFAPPRVEVQTDALGLSAQEVEELVTVPLEQGLTGMPGLDTLRSKSIPQQSSIELIFVKGTDIIEARRLVSERIQTITPTLPSWATPPVVLQPLSATSRVMKIGVRSDSLDLIEQATLVRYKIRPELMSLPGVANVAVWGMRKNQWQIQIDPDRMRAEGVTLEQVMGAASAGTDAGLLKHRTGTKIGTGGYVDSGDQRYVVQHVLPLDSAETLKQIVVSRDGGRTVLMGDVADVVKGHQLLIGDAVINDGDGLLLIVEKLPWGNTLDVTHDVEEALATMQPALQDLEIDTTIFRPASFVELAIENLTQALTLGILLVALVLVFFLFQWRTAVISLVAIPLSLVAAAYVLHLRGETTNTMVLAGLVIAVGVVVDDAIIDVENIVRRLREHRAQGGTRSTASIVLDASMEVRSPIVYATLIILAAAIPVFFLTGLMGSFFQPLALSYTLAVAASMLVAVTVTPAMALILLRRATLQAEAPRHVRGLQAWVHPGAAAHRAQAPRGLRGRRGAGRRRGGGRAPARPGPAPDVPGARLPHALGPRTQRVLRRDDVGHPGREPGAARGARGAQLRGACRAGRDGRRGVRHLLRRELDQHRPGPGLRGDPRPGPDRRRRVPRAPPGRPDLPQGAHPRGAHRSRGGRRRPGLRGRPRRHRGQGARDRGRHRGHPRRQGPAHRPADPDPPPRRPGRPRQGPSRGAEAGRRAPSGGRLPGGRRSCPTCSAPARRTTSWCGACPRRARPPTTSGTCSSTPRAAARCGWPTSPRSR